MKYPCDIIRDLMPLCADSAASEASGQAVRAHIGTCTECARIWSEMQQELDLPEETPAPQEEGYKKAAGKYRKKRIAVMLCVFFAALLGGLCIFDYLDTVPTSRPCRTRAGVITNYLMTVTGSHIPFFLPEYEILAEQAWESEPEKFFHWVYLPEINQYGVVATEKNEKGRYSLCLGTGIIPFQEGAEIDSAMPVPDSTGTWSLFRAKDVRVHEFRITVSGETQCAEVSGGCAVLHFRAYDRSYSRKTSPAVTGEALDANGNLLYTMTGTDEIQGGYRVFEWKKTA